MNLTLLNVFKRNNAQRRDDAQLETGVFSIAALETPRQASPGTAYASIDGERTFTEEQFSAIVKTATRMEIDEERAVELAHRERINAATAKEMEQFTIPDTISENEAYRILTEIGLEKYAKNAIDTVSITRNRVDDVSRLLEAKTTENAMRGNAIALRKNANAPARTAITAYLHDMRDALAQVHPDLAAFLNPFEYGGNYHITCKFADPRKNVRTLGGRRDVSLNELLCQLSGGKNSPAKNPAAGIGNARRGFMHVQSSGIAYSGEDYVSLSTQVPDTIYFFSPMEISIEKEFNGGDSIESMLTTKEESCTITFRDPSLFVSFAPVLKQLENRYRAEFPGLLPEKWEYVKDFCEEQL